MAQLPAELEKAILERLERVKMEIALRMEQKAVDRAPVNTGNLKASITSGVDGNFVWVGAGFKEEVNYARFVEYGTPPHVIKPTTEKKALRFKKDQNTILTKKVDHPGTRPNPFLRTAMFEVIKEIPEIIEKHFGGKQGFV